MNFRINLATRVYVNTGLLKFWTSAALLVLALLMVANVWGIAADVGERKSLERQVAAMSEKFKSANKGMTEKDYAALQARINFANATIEKKMYNWLELLDRLEQVVPEGVAITSLDPDPKDRALKLVGVTRNFRNLRTFLEHLEGSKYFTDVYLLSQAEMKLADVSQGITFTLSCKVAGK